jgi:single-stranded-DNA-specific exonuclease
VYEAAVEQIRKEPSLLQYAVLVLAHPEWHQGVIGIVASRLVEEYTRPVILLNAPESDLARGSARSVEGYHITQAIATQADLLEGFGGHPMAAGLAIRTEYIDAFRRGVSRAIVKQRIGAKPEPTIDIAGEIELSDLTLETAEELEAMAPFGVGNPPLNLLCRQVGIEEVREIGKGGKHRKLLIETGREPVEVLWWNSADVHLPDGPLDLVVRIRPGVFRGEKSLTVTLQDFYAAGEKEAQPAQPRFECIQDLRRVEEPEEELIALLQAEPDLAIWGEAHALSPSLRDRVKHRFEIPSADALAIWTLPPDLTTLAALLERVRPTRLYVFARDPGLDSVDAFIKRFAGLVRYAINTYRGCTGLANLASALAQTEQVVRAGLEMLPSLGVTAEVAQDGAVLFSLLESPQEREVADLDYLLRETGAFRRLFRRADDLYYFLSLPLEETEA